MNGENPRQGSRIPGVVAAFCWLAIFGGIAWISLDPRRGWIGITIIGGALITALTVYACRRRRQQ